MPVVGQIAGAKQVVALDFCEQGRSSRTAI